MGRLDGSLGRLEAFLGVLDRSFEESELSWTVLGASWGFLGALWGAWEAAPRRKTISDPTWPGVSWESPVVLFVRGPPGAAPRARSGSIVNTVNLLAEILARLWPVGPANSCPYARNLPMILTHVHAHTECQTFSRIDCYPNPFPYPCQ